MLREVVMLRNRSRAVTSKQALMPDHNNNNTHINQNHTTQSSSFLNSPRFFKGFLSTTLSDAAAENMMMMMSPTSILKNSKKIDFSNPFGYYYNRNPPQPQMSSLPKEQIHEKLDSESIGLAIIDSIKDERKMVLFGAKLKVQIPNSVISSESTKSPGDFGIKTRNSHTLSPFSSVFESPPQGLNMKLSLSEMEMSEEYTCVITHGPNPKTIHIFDDSIVDSCCGDVVGVSELKNKQKNSRKNNNSMDFLSFCYTCKNNLQEGKDIFMYRGEKAFCSNECRCQEMISEVGEKNSEME